MESQIFATNLGASLYRTRWTNKIVFLRNETAAPFIAGDQPIVNLLDSTAPDEIELYYPLSPRLAMIFAVNPHRHSTNDREVTFEEVENLNRIIIAKSDDQVYANDAAYLRSLITSSSETDVGLNA